MSVEPGFQGQPFKEETLESLRKVFKMRQESNLNFSIGVDGHVNNANAKVIVFFI